MGCIMRLLSDCLGSRNIVFFMISTALLFAFFTVSVAIGISYAESDPPPAENPNYPYTYDPPEIQTQNLIWNDITGDTLTFEFPQRPNSSDPRPKYYMRYGELRKTNFSIVKKTGTRTDLVRIPTDGSVTHIRQNFTANIPELNWNNYSESGPSYGYYCEGSQCPEYVDLCISCGGAYNPGGSNSGWWIHSTRFDVLNPDAYGFPFSWLTLNYSVAKPVKEGPGEIIEYTASVPIEVSISQEFRQWQVNEILAGRLHHRRGNYMRVNADPLNFGFTRKEAARIGRYFGNGQWISYDHFNWIQYIVEEGQFVVDELGAIDNTQKVWSITGKRPDPPLVSFKSGLTEYYSDGFPMYFDEWPHREPIPQAYPGNSVYNPKWMDGLVIQDAPNFYQRGRYAKFETHLVGVIVDPASGVTVGFEDLAEIYKEQASLFSFHWTFLQTKDDTNAPGECFGYGEKPPDCGWVYFNTDLSSAGNGIAYVYWQGENPPPNLNPFPILMQIDVEPGNNKNPVDIGNPATIITVAVLSSQNFSALEIDLQSIRFGPAEAEEVDGQAEVEDIDGDGDDDLLFQFALSDTGIKCGDKAVALTGRTFGGILIAGTDSITTTGCEELSTYDYDKDGDVDGKDLVSFIYAFSQPALPEFANEYGLMVGD